MLRFATIAGTALLLTLPVAAQQQDNSAPAQQQQDTSAPAQQQQQTDTKDQQKKQEKKKSSGDANAFPEAQSEKAAQQNQQPDSNVPSAPQPSSQKDQASPAKKPSSADQNPFPEAQSEKAAHQEEQQDQQDQAPASGDSSYSSSQVHLKDLAPAGGGDEDTAPIQASSPLPYDPKLAKKDAQIGDYYLETGDSRGAYDRFVEAARSDPGNAEAVWGLAESARRLQMNEVAIKNYRLYLAALPNGPHAKEIRKVLKGMGLEPGS
jgi:tetratricopeptide (TPR) repeat protein